MCVLLILKDRVEGYPWVVAANRDESLSRPSRPPGPIRGPLRFFGGVDLQSGGTWLGVNENGLLTVITNRPGGDEDPDRPSRGQVPVAVLLQPDVASASAFLRDLDRDRTPWTIAATPDDEDRHVEEASARQVSGPRYNPFNLFVAQGDHGHVAYRDDSPRTEDVLPGIHVLTNHHDLDRLPADEILDRIGRDRVWPADEKDRLIATLKEVLAHHGGVGPERYSICKHGEEFGTVSSTILAVGEDFPGEAIYLHAEGPPCETSFRDYTSEMISAFH